MWVYLNGSLVPEELARISIFDRGFLYGDGVFDAIPFFDGCLFRFEEHWNRFAGAIKNLRFQFPREVTDVRLAADELIRRNGLQDGILRIQLSRGVGPRGYSLRNLENPTWTMSTHKLNAPDGSLKRWKLHTASFQIGPEEFLSHFKSCNKLLNVLSRAEAEDHGADEALLCTIGGEVCETSAGNLFWLENNSLVTPPETFPLLKGITRGVVLELAGRLDLQVRLESGPRERILNSGGVFITLSSLGIVEVSHLDSLPLQVSPLVQRLWENYWALVRGHNR